MKSGIDTGKFDSHGAINETIANLEGVGKVSVSITFESSIEKKYAYESVTETSNGIPRISARQEQTHS